MEHAVEREQLIRNYVLGYLAEEERTRVEIGVLTDRDYYNELLLVEDELTDDLIIGGLSDYEKERISESICAVPELRQKLGLKKLIAQYITKGRTENSTCMSWEETLHEAARNRNLIDSLINPDWMGVQVLATLRSVPQGNSELASKLNVDDVRISPILARLMQSGVIEQRRDLFSCTELGDEILRKFEALSNMPPTL
jgi:predicted transcriptional regulator